MIEVIERDRTTAVYFNLDPNEGCCCEEANGCGDIVYYFPSIQKASGFARELRLGELEPLRKHWRRECECTDEFDAATCIHSRLSHAWQVWDE